MFLSKFRFFSLILFVSLIGCENQGPSTHGNPLLSEGDSNISKEGVSKTDLSLESESNPHIVKKDDKKDGESSAVAATVNGKNITVNEVDKFIERDPGISQMVEQQGKFGDIDPRIMIRKQVLNMMIERELLLTEAKSRSIMTEKELNDGINSYIAMYGGEENLKKVMSKAGITQEDFKNSIREDLLVRKIINDEVISKVNVSEDDAKKEFESSKNQYRTPPMVHAKHILVSVKSPDEDSKAKAKIESLYKEVSKKDASFEKVAKENSDCPSKENGGDLGFFSKDMMVKEFSDKAFSLKPGEISEPVKSQFGYHIIKLEEVKKEEDPDFNKAKETIVMNIRAKREKDIAQPFIDGLKSKAQITVNL